MYLLTEAFSALILLVPALALLNRLRIRSRGRSLVYLAFTLYLAAVYHLTGLPTVGFITFDVNLNLIPFREFRKELVLSVLNVAMFVPLGFFLPLLWEKFRRLRPVVLFGLGATLTIELAQLLTYRATDINDIITNTLGASVGYLLFVLIRPHLSRWFKPEAGCGDLWILLALTAGVMFFLQPGLKLLIQG